ncbi:MAG: hypothetical protein D6705_10410 [Deltaproteobacteria bacterium]|nr:MAG: hypothetical protein D6705_10410 [Deltaproteobacteria bacterium]
MDRHVPSALGIAALVLCAPIGACKLKQTSGLRSSGQSRLMDQTYAGQNKCNPDEHDKPFVIEWDATQMSSFESLAASDIVFVRYEGCSLKILDECKNDSIRGEQGAYKPVEWTTGQLETIDIANEGDLYAKLPLGKATLGARVAGGERFRMEYYVAGTRYASRDAVYAADLEGRYGCDEATHFVYAYNLGAFALGSANEFDASAGGSVYGFGAGGSQHSHYRADKKGGDLSACRSDAATEIAGCKAPIRLHLRKIRPGRSPEAEAMAAPDTPESLSATAVLNQKIAMSDEARARIEAATAKLTAGDGKGCLAELDAHDRLDPKHKSTDPNSPFALTRAMCVMKSGKCDAGKGQMRKTLEKQPAFAQSGPEQIDRTVDAYAAMYCEGRMNPTDALRKALAELQNAAFQTRKDVAFCDERYARVKRLLPKAKPRDDDDVQIRDAERSLISIVPLCYQRAGDCDKAWQAYQEVAAFTVENAPAEQREQILRSGFEGIVRKCAAAK